MDGGEPTFANEELLRKIFDEAGTLGEVPSSYAETSIQRWKIHQSFVKWLRACGAMERLLNGTVTETPIEPTYTASGTTSSIEMICLNSAAMRVLSTCEVVPARANGIKRHKPVQWEIGLEKMKEYADEMAQIRKFPQGNVFSNSGGNFASLRTWSIRVSSCGRTNKDASRQCGAMVQDG